MVTKRYLDSAYNLETPQDTQNLYRKWASTYEDEVTENGYASPLRTANALQKSGAKLDAPLLDIGCGTGLSGLFLKDAGFNYIDGSDFTPEMLKLAKDKNVYKHLYQSNIEEPFGFLERDYQTITAIGVFSPAHAGPKVIHSVFELLPRGGFFGFTLNDHALEDEGYRANIRELVMGGKARIRWEDYGDHLPKINLKSLVVVIEKIA